MPSSLEEPEVLLVSLRVRTSACRRNFRSSRSRSRRHSSSGGIGTPLHVSGRTLCAGRPGFLRVCSLFRHFARRFWNQTCTKSAHHCSFSLCNYYKGKVRALVIAPQVDTATTEALRYMARTKQRRTYLPYTFPAVAGTHLPTPK